MLHKYLNDNKDTNDSVTPNRISVVILSFVSLSTNDNNAALHDGGTDGFVGVGGYDLCCWI